MKYFCDKKHKLIRFEYDKQETKDCPLCEALDNLRSCQKLIHICKDIVNNDWYSITKLRNAIELASKKGRRYTL